jgi:hypothetical protein
VPKLGDLRRRHYCQFGSGSPVILVVRFAQNRTTSKQVWMSVVNVITAPLAANRKTQG